MGGRLTQAQTREYGRAIVKVKNEGRLLKGVESSSQAWMSHGDSLDALPEGFVALAETDDIPFAAIANDRKKFYGVQFHPEVAHTIEGKKVLRNFLYDICSVTGDWTTESFIESSIAELQKTIGDDRVILGISGGVDSTVTAVLLHRAVGDHMTAIFVNNGLLRIMANSTEMLNAYFHPAENVLVFGTSNGAWHLASDMDIVAHELGHKVLNCINPGTGSFEMIEPFLPPGVDREVVRKAHPPVPVGRSGRASLTGAGRGRWARGTRGK